MFFFIAGDQARAVALLELSLDNCIDMMVAGGAFLFAFFIGNNSGLLPWIRVAVLAYGWLVPPSVLSIQQRGRLFEFMEVIGKWCLSMTYMFVILMTAVNVKM